MLIYYLVKPIDGEENEAVYLSTLFCCGSEVRGNPRTPKSIPKAASAYSGEICPFQLS
jgi:hypothetical protein